MTSNSNISHQVEAEAPNRGVVDHTSQNVENLDGDSPPAAASAAVSAAPAPLPAVAAAATHVKPYDVEKSLILPALVQQTLQSIEKNGRKRPPGTCASEKDSEDVAPPPAAIAVPLERFDLENPPAPPGKVAVAYEEMETEIKESIKHAPSEKSDCQSPPVPPGNVAVAYEEMEIDIKESIKNAPSVGGVPLPPVYFAAAWDGKGGSTKNKRGNPKSAGINDAPTQTAQAKDVGEEKNGLSGNVDIPMQGEEDNTASQARTPMVPRAPALTEFLPPSRSTQNEPGHFPPEVAVAASARPTPRSMLPPPDEPSPSFARNSPSVRMFEVEAQLVEEQEVYDAERISITRDDGHIRPWWERYQHSLTFGLTGLVAVIAVVAVMASTRASSTGPPTESSIQTNSTLVPSMAPTDCALRMTRQAHKFELRTYKMISPVFAIDGADGILVTGSGFVIFFHLSESRMIMTRPFDYKNLGTRPSVAISGGLAVVGNPFENVVHVFERNEGRGIWEETSDALTPNSNGGIASYFGASVDIHGDTIVVGEPVDNFFKGSVNVFLRRDGGWQLQAKIHPENLCDRALFGLDVAIHGDTVIAGAACRQSIYIYRIDKKSGDISNLQDPLEDVFVDKKHLSNKLYLFFSKLGIPSAINLSSDHHLFLTNGTGILLYQRPDGAEPFTFAQYIEVEKFSSPYVELEFGAGDSTIGDVAADIGENLIADYGEGYLFSPAVDGDLMAFASGNALHVFSQRHDGYWEEDMKIERDNYADRTNATLFKGTIAVSGRSLIFASEDAISTYDLEGCTQNAPTISPTSMQSPPPHQSQNSSVLLTLHPSASPTTLNPTTSPEPTEMPSLSARPTSSLVPTSVPSKSQVPSSSAAPTKCYSLEITIYLDTKPSETSWNITKVNEDGTIENVITSPDYSDFAFGGDKYDHHVCLQEGKYEFAIYDSDGDGMCCVIIDGFYKVQLSGETIAEGGEFSDREITTFSLPYVPNSTSTLPWRRQDRRRRGRIGARDRS